MSGSGRPSRLRFWPRDDRKPASLGGQPSILKPAAFHSTATRIVRSAPPSPANPIRGAVTFIGAGPGAADLLTLRGREALRAAEVVVHDRLVPKAVLELVPAGVEQISIDRGDLSDPDPGRTTGQLLVSLARQGCRVARLKSGDPTVFARLAEELGPLREAGVAVEIVPGVTAAVAAAAAAGIPLTSRAAASSLTIATGHAARGKEEPPGFARLAALPGSLAIYMGVEQIPIWSRELIEAGRPAETPVVVVSRCSWPDQQVNSSTLADCLSDARQQGWRSPAVLIVGDVAAVAPPGPLAGRRVIVTRPAGQEGELVARLRAAGGQPLHVPVIQITPPADVRPLDQALRRLGSYDWIVFASGNGVRGFLERLRAAGLDGRALGSARIAAIGPATRAAIEEAGYVCDRMPDEYRSEGLVDALAAGPAGGRFLLVRAERGREALRKGLEAARHAVDEVAAYASQPLESLAPDTLASLPAGGEGHWITVTSGAIVEAAVRLFGERIRGWQIASLSPVTSAALRRFGLEPTVEPKRATIADLVNAIGCHAQSGSQAAGSAQDAGSAGAMAG